MDRQPPRAWGAVLVAVVAGAVFAPSLLNGFAYDDVALIVSDPRVHSLAAWPDILRNGYWGDPTLGLYRPLTTLSFALDWSVGFGRPGWFHLTNLLLHAVASALVFLLLARWFIPAAALAGGLLFAVHPVHVEAVANVVGRSELFAAIAVLGALLLWRADLAERTRVVRTAGVAVLLALGLAAKESALVLLPLILLVDFADAALDPWRPLPWLRRNAAPLIALAAVVALWVAVRFAVLGGMAPSRVDAAFDLATGTSARIATALQAWPVWLRLLFAPVTLLSDYGPRTLMPLMVPNTAALLGATLALALTAGGLFAIIRRERIPALLLLWFPITILPVSNLLVPTGVIVAERTLYLPSVAASLAVAALATRLAAASAPASTRVPRAAVLAFSLVLGLFAGRALVRIPAWRSTETMFAALTADRPDSFRAQWYRAREARNAERVEEAAQLYDRAMTIWPYRRGLTVEAATYAAETGRLGRAHELAAFATATWPDDVDALRILAAVSLDLGDSAAAHSAVQAGLRISPDDDVLRRIAAVLHLPGETQ